MESKATLFEFVSYIYEPENRRIFFNYKTDFKDGKSMSFTETVLLPDSAGNNIQKELLDKILQCLHIMLGISYYKLYCATKVKLQYELSKKEADFWNIVYRKGLGEFFFKNNLNPKISPKFAFTKNKKIINFKLQASGYRGLVGIGGGKDSIVVAELLKQNKTDFDTFFVQTGNSTDLTDKIIEIVGSKNIPVRRILDPKIFEKHPYQGHIPVSAIYAFLGTLLSALYGYSYIIVGNEFSSNFGNTKYKGELINHQWSKSFEFESLFNSYLKENVTEDIKYFSLLRSFYEIRIVKIFSKMKQYFPYFSSCNSNFKINREETGKLWCGHCPKCAFVFTLMSAYLGKKELIEIFGNNLYKDENLLPLFKNILGFGKMKPFDCVGTFQEAQSALYMASKKFKNDFIVNYFIRKIKLTKDVFKTQKNLLFRLNLNFWEWKMFISCVTVKKVKLPNNI